MHIDDASSGALAANISDGIGWGGKKTWRIAMNFIRVFDSSLMGFSTSLIQARLIQLNWSYLVQGDD